MRADERGLCKVCEICRQNPCHPRCPNAPESRPVHECTKCHGGIFEGDKFLESGGEYICMECLEDMSVSELLEIAGMKLSEAR